MTTDDPGPLATHGEAEGSVTLDTKTLRALAHPVRVKLLGLLRQGDASTATRLAAELGLNSGATSYHLRQLAGAGLVQEDPSRGSGRDRWWRPTSRYTYLDTTTLPEADLPAAAVYLNAVAAGYAERVVEYAARAFDLPDPWKTAGTISDWRLRLSARETEELVARLVEIVESYRHSESGVESSPGAEPVIIQLQAMVQLQPTREDERPQQ